MKKRTYKDKARWILKNLCIYRKLSQEEREAFENIADDAEIQIDNLLTTFRRKYL